MFKVVITFTGNSHLHAVKDSLTDFSQAGYLIETTQPKYIRHFNT
jgi:hypothetical protein